MDTPAVTAAPTTRYADVLGIPGVRRLVLSTTLSRIAARMLGVALVLFVLRLYGSPTITGIAVFLVIGPGLVVSPIAGALLDRHPRTQLILLDYLVAAAAVFVLVALAAAGHLPVALLLPIVGLSSLTAPLSGTGSRSLLPQIVEPHLWDRVNAIDSMSMEGASVIGPALAGGLAGLLSPSIAMLAGGVMFLAGAAPLVRFPHAQAPTQPDGHLLRNALEGLMYVLRNPTLRGLALTMAVANLAFGAMTVGLPILVFSRLQSTDAVVGLLWAAEGVFAVGSGLLMGRLDTRGRERTLMMIGMAGAAIATLLLAVAPTIPVAVAGMALFGLSVGPVDIGLFALRQRRTEREWFGRAFAVSMSLNFSGMPIGAAIAGPILQHSITAALGVGAMASLLAGVIVWRTVPREA